MDQAKPGRCTQGTICAVASATGVYTAPYGGKALFNQCGRDADCSVFTGNRLTSPPPPPICCDDYDAWASATCSGVNQELLGRIKSGCGVRPNCVTEKNPIPPPAAAGGSCPAPPRERCCSRVLSNPAATVRMTLPAGVLLSSVTVWRADAAGGPLVAGGHDGDKQLEGMRVNVGSGLSPSVCNILPAQTGPGLPGYEGRPLVCGAALGPVVSVSLPNVLAGGRPGPVAVKVCSVAAADAGPVQGVTLWLQRG